MHCIVLFLFIIIINVLDEMVYPKIILTNTTHSQAVQDMTFCIKTEILSWDQKREFFRK